MITADGIGDDSSSLAAAVDQGSSHVVAAALHLPLRTAGWPSRWLVTSTKLPAPE